MARLPRLAVGTIQPGVQSQAILGALVEAFRREGIQVQSFRSRACFPTYPGASVVAGLAPRHLDSWLMTPDVCRDLFARGACAADLAIVEGHYDSPADVVVSGGRLEPLCQWLDLPRVVVIDASLLAECQLPPRPSDAEGLLLDRVVDETQLARLSTDLEALWGIPVLGALDTLAGLRSVLSSAEEGTTPHYVYEELGDHFMRHWQPRRLLEIATRRAPPRCSSRQLGFRPFLHKLTVAVAYDEAFHCYFPDTLDLLECLGATVADFSPLHDECLPEGTDVVYLGCGHPERYSAALSENHCMKAALRSHLRAGRRIYAEGAAAAYLCQQMETCSGELRRMVGILPATARLTAGPRDAVPVEVTLARSNWLGDCGARVRGYRNGRWRFEPVAAEASFVAETEHRFDMIGCHQAIGSLLHLDFAAPPDFVRQFFAVPVLQPVTPDPWSPVA